MRRSRSGVVSRGLSDILRSCLCCRSDANARQGSGFRWLSRRTAAVRIAPTPPGWVAGRGCRAHLPLSLALRPDAAAPAPTGAAALAGIGLTVLGIFLFAGG